MERRIRRKLNNESGFTVIEMLCCCLILVMLSIVINAELDMVGTLYGSMIAENEAEILLSSASAVLSDELRYAVKDSMTNGEDLILLSPTDPANTDGELRKFVFESDTYWNNGEKTAMYINEDGHLVVQEAVTDDEGIVTGTLTGEPYPVLSASDYGKPTISGTTYTIQSIHINKSGDKFTYTITLKRGTGKYKDEDELPPIARGTVRNMPYEKP